MKSRVTHWAAALAVGAGLAASGWGQVPMSIGTYVQTFDSLAASGDDNPWTDNVTLPGWYATRSLQGAVTVYRASPGTETTGSLYSFGTANSSERALGSIASGTPGNLAYALYFTNDTGAAQSDITITYTAEQWRNGGNTAPQQLYFDYQVSPTLPVLDAQPGGPGTSWNPFPALDFTSPTVGATATALNGNDPTNRVTFANVVLTGVTVQPGEILVLRWLDLNDPGNDHGLAIDDLTVVFPGVMPPPPTAPTIIAQPQSRTNNAGTAAIFSVTAEGTEPLSYQWRRDGVPLAAGGNVVGAQNPTLTLNNVLKADEGSFDVIITNIAGAVTSQVATLTVIDPAINTQPTSRTNVPGDYAVLSVGAAGTGTLRYQWWKDGQQLAGATASSLRITNVTPADAGNYCVVVTNALGAMTSSVATLTVMATPAVRFAHWDFNDTSDPSTTNSPPITFGTGSATVMGGTYGAYVSGTPTDPGSLMSSNWGWNTSGYPPQGTANKTAGAQFNVSTVGYTNIFITWQERHSSTASRYVRFQYSLNGTDFVDGNSYLVPADSVFVQFTANLSEVAGAADNPNFAFRIVSEWGSTATGSGADVYLPTYSGTSYSSAGTIRFDMVNVFGDPLVPPCPPVQSFRIELEDFDNDPLTLPTPKITWAPANYVLVESDDLTKPLAQWTVVAGATSPYRPTVQPGSQRFYALRCP
jgi:hypothetical protein